MSRCGKCTACCNVLKIDEINKPAYTMCTHCDKGCAIHDSKPTTCAEFECAYYQTNAPIQLRPDNCGVIFLKKTDRIFTGIKLADVEPTEAAIGQVRAFTEQGFSVVLLEDDKTPPHIVLAKGHKTENVYKEYKEALWQHIVLT